MDRWRSDLSVLSPDLYLFIMYVCMYACIYHLSGHPSFLQKFFKIYFQLKDRCFTMLVSAIQQCESVYTCISSLQSLPLTLPSYPSRLSQSTRLSSLGYTAASRQLYYISKCVCFNATLSIQSEVSEVNKKEENKYCVLVHMYGIQKNSTDEPICRTGIETQTQRHSGGRRG